MLTMPKDRPGFIIEGWLHQDGQRLRWLHVESVTLAD